MQRVKFQQKGMQKKFLVEVLGRLGCPSLRELVNRGFEVNYSTLKNYFNESRLLPLSLFRNLSQVAGISLSELKFEILSGNWGQVLGGKISRKIS